MDQLWLESFADDDQVEALSAADHFEVLAVDDIVLPVLRGGELLPGHLTDPVEVQAVDEIGLLVGELLPGHLTDHCM